MHGVTLIAGVTKIKPYHKIVVSHNYITGVLKTGPAKYTSTNKSILLESWELVSLEILLFSGQNNSFVYSGSLKSFCVDFLPILTCCRKCQMILVILDLYHCSKLEKPYPIGI